MAKSRQKSTQSILKLCLLCVGFLVGQHAQAEPDSIKSVFNSFIATFAKEQVDWRKDIETLDSPDMVPPGKQLGVSKMIGYFAFSPMTWDDFTSEERVVIIRHQKFKSFIISLRNANLYPSVGIAETMGGARVSPDYNPAKPGYPVDGIAPERSGSRTAVKTVDVIEKSIGQQSNRAKEETIFKLSLSPEQVLRKNELLVEVF